MQFLLYLCSRFKLANYRLMITIEQLKDVQQRADKLKAYLQIDEKRIQLEEEELHTQAPGFWDDAKAAEVQMRKVKGLKRWIEGYEGVRAAVEELALAFDYYKEELVTEEEVDAAYAHALSEVEDLEMKNMLSHEEDQMPAVLKIVSGAGGTEAQDWAEQLMRMYMRYCEKHDYKVTIENLQEGDEAGIKTVTDRDLQRRRRDGVRLSQIRERCTPSGSRQSLQRTRQTNDVLCISFRGAAHRRYHRSGSQPRRYQLGHFPQFRCRRTERQQSRVRRATPL